MIRYMQGTKFFRKPVICKSVIHKTVMDKDLLYIVVIGPLSLKIDFLMGYNSNLFTYSPRFVHSYST